jgi:hypothetical protein
MDTCQNCGSGFTPGQNYCGSCGQRRSVARLSIGHLSHEFLHALTHVDRSLFSLLLPVLVRPGYVTRDYVQGKRKRYFGPLAWVVVIGGLFSAEVVFSHFFAALASYQNPFVGFLERHVNITYLTQAPVLALYCRLLFWRGEFNFAEYLVLAAYTAGVRMLFFGLVIVPLVVLLRPIPSAALYGWLASMFLWVPYFGLATAQMCNGRRAVSWLKGSLAAALAQFTTAVLLSAVATLVQR